MGVRLKLALAHVILFAGLWGLALGTLALVLEPAAVASLAEGLGGKEPLLAAIAVGALLVALVASWAITSRALAPLTRLAQVAEGIRASGDFSRRVPQPGVSDEVGRVVEAFNALLERVEAVLKAQQQFLADTSHELRTPLTVIRGNLELLQRELDPQTRLECATEAQEEAARMSRLVDDLLFLAQADAGQAIRHRPFRLDLLVAEVAERMRPLARSHHLEVGPLDLTTINGDEERMRQLVVNLLDNAIRYTPPGGTISVRLRREGPNAELSVRDTGVGIAAEHLPRIFDRFYRVDAARSRAEGGTGLGLAIVKYVAEAHGGQVSVHSQPGQGSEFTVRLRAEPSWAVKDEA